MKWSILKKIKKTFSGKGVRSMKGVMRACVPSIEDSIRIVEDLRAEGVPKERIMLITNVAGKFAILRNVDLRGRSGRVISAHRLVQHTKGIFHLQEYAKLQAGQPGYQQEQDPVSDYWQDIQDGSIGVFVVAAE